MVGSSTSQGCACAIRCEPRTFVGVVLTVRKAELTRLSPWHGMGSGTSSGTHPDTPGVWSGPAMDRYVALCAELDIASQGAMVEQARTNLAEAVELFFETAEPSEVDRRLRAEVYVTRLNIARG